MPEFLVTLIATASHTVCVEAEDKDDAAEKVWDIAALPFFSAGMDGDLGDWEVEYDYIEEIQD
jgi:hypothetical protein